MQNNPKHENSKVIKGGTTVKWQASNPFQISP